MEIVILWHILLWICENTNTIYEINKYLLLFMHNLIGNSKNNPEIAMYKKNVPSNEILVVWKLLVMVSGTF